MKTLFATIALLATVAMPALAGAQIGPGLFGNSSNLNITIQTPPDPNYAAPHGGPVIPNPFTSWIVIVPVDDPRVPLAMTSEWVVLGVSDNRKQCHEWTRLAVRHSQSPLSEVIAGLGEYRGWDTVQEALRRKEAWAWAKCRATQEAVAVGSVGTFGQ